MLGFRLVVCLAVLLVGVPASAQVMLLSGGTSTLFGGSGGEITAFFPESTVSASAGFANGHFVFGASDEFTFHGWDVTAGDKNFGYSFDGAGLGVSTRGLFLQHRAKDATLAVFVGSTGIGYATPFMATVRDRHIGAGFFFERHLHNGLLLSSLVAADSAGSRTAVQGAAYRGRFLHVSGSGGLLQNQKYLTGEADYQPIRDISFSATHVDYFLTDHLTANSFSTFAALGRVTLQASLLNGRYKMIQTSGASAGAGLRIGPVTVRSSVYESNHRVLLVHVVQERFHRWNVSGVVSQSQGQTAYAFGGGYHGNRISMSLDHSVLFFPVNGKGFQQTTTVQVSLRIHDTTLNLQTNLDPMMRVQYTAYGSSYAQGPVTGPAVNRHSYSTSGKFLIAGAVVDERGQPVEGAAIRLQGGMVVYSDSQGKFFARVKHDKPLALAILLEEFAAPGRWAVKTCPAEAAPGTDVLIQLKREPAP